MRIAFEEQHLHFHCTVCGNNKLLDFTQMDTNVWTAPCSKCGYLISLILKFDPDSGCVVLVYEDEIDCQLHFTEW